MVFQKPTDKNTLLSANSHHPLPLKKGVPLSQLYRLSRICDSEEKIDKLSEILSKHFSSRGHPRTWFQSAFDKVKTSERIQLLNNKKKTNKKKHFQLMISLLTKNSHQIKSIVNKH